MSYFVRLTGKRTGETNGEFRKKLIDELRSAFKKICGKYKKPIGNYANILNARGLYYLDPKKDIVCSNSLDWTILMNDDVQLEEPIGARTIFVKNIDNIFDVIPLISNKIQTLGVAIKETEKRLKFCEQATFKGVSRCVDIGLMNNYDTPWDGILFINRLVRWTSMTTSS